MRKRSLVVLLLITGLACGGCSISQGEGIHVSAEAHSFERRSNPQRYHRSWSRPYISIGRIGSFGDIGGIIGPSGVCD